MPHGLRSYTELSSFVAFSIVWCQEQSVSRGTTVDETRYGVEVREEVINTSLAPSLLSDPEDTHQHSTASSLTAPLNQPSSLPASEPPFAALPKNIKMQFFTALVAIASLAGLAVATPSLSDIESSASSHLQGLVKAGCDIVCES